MTTLSTGLLNRLCMGSLACMAAATLLAAGCSSGSHSGTRSDRSMSGSNANAGSVGEAVSDDDLLARLDATYVVGPTAARAIGYRIAWNARAGSASTTLTDAALAGDSLFLVDSSNSLTRLMRSSGSQAWNWPVGERSDTILGVRRAQWRGKDVILALTEGDLHIFDTDNGIQLDRQRLRGRVASTAPIVFGDMIIYGSVNGQVIWHNFAANAFMKGNTLLGSINAPLAVHPAGLVVAVSETGQIMALGAQSGVGLWTAHAREAIDAKAAITNEAVFVTSRDQFIRCLDAGNGEVLWRRLHSEPITAAPVALGDRVYVDTADMGLVCYEALPYEDLDGNLLWSNEDVSGTVIGRHQGNLMVWDDEAHTLTLVEEARGAVVDSVSLPNAHQLAFDRFESGDIYAIGNNGYVTRLAPRN